MSSYTVRSVSLFLGLALVAAVLLVTAQTMGRGFAQLVLVQMGCVVFGAGLTVFLLQMTSPLSQKQ